MYSTTRSKSFLAIALVIIPIILMNGIIPIVNAAWTQDGKTDVKYIAKPGRQPKLDGIRETLWDDSKTLKEIDMQPRLEFQMRSNKSYAYCLIIVKNSTHSANESVLLMLSNNGTGVETNKSKYFIDAKLVDINNKTEDRKLVAENYDLDDNPENQNITGYVSSFVDTGNNNTVYEFRFPYNNTNAEVDINWTFGGVYAAKIRVGNASTIVDNAATDKYAESPIFVIQFGYPPGYNPNGTIGDFEIPWILVSQISFGVVLGVFGMLGIMVVISKTKVAGLPSSYTSRKPVEQPKTAANEEGDSEEEIEAGGAEEENLEEE